MLADTWRWRVSSSHGGSIKASCRYSKTGGWYIKGCSGKRRCRWRTEFIRPSWLAATFLGKLHDLQVAGCGCWGQHWRDLISTHCARNKLTPYNIIYITLISYRLSTPCEQKGLDFIYLLFLVTSYANRSYHIITNKYYHVLQIHLKHVTGRSGSCMVITITNRLKTCLRWMLRWTVTIHKR